ncbi:phosphatidate cytidylyltransferase [Jeotgalibacillus proteolyticus]|uniref:Phosphatidate cytidylyltransferase n=1 Tax=Jeotgalibacillus proteolyticus TaxID=2082395 RepID=A0A2S5GG72_9BACL|nr:phosphatidate cytidylyltransferase [Jeotgalibacillus proteolyticus]PPA72032.1 phosphatidate cytidylyltransferase [Jeotgalibacillus proteolyticus]
MKQRLITGIIAAALFVPVVWVGGIVFIIGTYVIASVALYEVLKMRSINVFSIPGAISILTLWTFLLPNEYYEILNQLNYSKIETALLSVLLLLVYTVMKKNRFTFDDAAFAVFAMLYVGIGFYYFIETRDASILWVVYALLIIWTTDSGAYFIGKSMGKRKLWPDISPNKTVEGFVGGILSAIVVVIIFIQLVPLETNFWYLLFATVILSAFGQIGDLVESALKRHYGVKDSGRILPGHGGLLDRFDSLLFVLPLMHILQLI